MYTQFFGLKKKPFTLSPDPEFFYFSKRHSLAYSQLEYGMLHNVGFMALTGGAGAGKTTLLKYLLNRVRSPLNMAMIFNTQVDSHSLLEMLTNDFELTPASNRKSDLYNALYDHLLKAYSSGSRSVIFVDEAQNLTLEGFEELRMLSNLDNGNSPLLQIILVGQPQLRSHLFHPHLTQLTQRISIYYHLAPMEGNDIRKYIEHRLYVAGYKAAEPLFEESAVDLLGNISGGVPRIINSVCDASLTSAFAVGLGRISRQVVENVIADNQLLPASHGNRETISERLPHDRYEGGDSHLFTSPDSQRNSPSPGLSDFGGVLSHLLERISSLEETVREANAADTDKALKMLQEMLTEERERSRRYYLQLAELTRRYKIVLNKLQELKEPQNNGKVETQPVLKRRHKLWRIFRRGEE